MNTPSMKIELYDLAIAVLALGMAVGLFLKSAF
jgi:hypothetical protein